MLAAGVVISLVGPSSGNESWLWTRSRNLLGALAWLVRGGLCAAQDAIPPGERAGVCTVP